MNHISEIQEKMAQLGLDALLITDEKNQRYACGFPFTDGAIVVGRRGAWLITDGRYIEAASELAQGVETVLFDREHGGLMDKIRESLKSAGGETVGAEEKSLSYGDYLDYQKELGCTLTPASGIFTSLRASKDKEELLCMIEAQRIAEKALEEVLGIIHPGMTERELAAELTYRMLLHGGEGNSFDPIAVSGPNTSMPHGVPGDRPIMKGDFVTMDFGCIKHGYCSDMTRTVAVKEASDEMRNIYGIVLRAQLEGIRAARSGIPGCEIDAAARQVITDAGYGDYFSHGFGHSLGLLIHETPNLNGGGKTLMPEGAVCSAEPGIYLPGKFGVRIEDVMILRPWGAEVITKAPKELVIL